MSSREGQQNQFSKINNVSTRNISVIARYVEDKLGTSILLTSNLQYSPEYLLNEHNWIPLATYNEIMNRAIVLLDDPQAPYKMGLSALELESWGLFRHVRQIFLTLVIDPIMVYRKVSEYNPLFNNTKDLNLLTSSKTHCIFTIKFKEGVSPVEDFHSDKYIQGILASIPRIWHLPSSLVSSVAHEYDLVELLHRVGNIPYAEIECTDDIFFVRGEAIGRRVKNIKDEVLWKNEIGSRYRVTDHTVFEHLVEATETHASEPIIITRDIQINELLSLSCGEMYNAPHFVYHVSWEKPAFGTQLKHIFSQRWRSHKTYEDAITASLATMKDYTVSLEQKVIERTHELELARTESEYWRKKAETLLSTMLPRRIARTMIESKLESQELFGTVLYTDIVGFTEYSKNHELHIVNDELKEYFAEITHIVTSHGGWVNKFLGDGMLVVFGLDNEASSIDDAVHAAKQIVKNIDKYSWGTRISVTTGSFTVGEYGNDEHRRFDCVGNTLNLGSRLQSHANVNEIIVCEDTYAALVDSEHHIFGKKMEVDLKGIGKTEAYTLCV